MKKLILLTLLSITTLIGFSQEPIKLVSYRNCIGYWDSELGAYNYQPINYSKITFTVHEEYISSDDQSHSIYRIIESLPKRITETNETISAKCLDEKNKNCVFAIMTQNDGSTSVAVIYDSHLYIYFIN